jgi:glycosyltransferase involved in cell wall biosynthesis
MSDIDLSYIHVVASDEVNHGLTRLNTKLNSFGSYEVFNTYGLQAIKSILNKRIKRYHVVFTVFGPNYLRVKAKKEIVGFAQPWMLNFDNPISQTMSFFSRNILRTKFSVQWLFFLRADHYIVELEHVKEALVAKKSIDSDKVIVVHNTVSSLYLDKSLWKSIYFTKNENELSLGIVTRDYPHKNLDILPLVAQQLELHHSLKVRFYTTLNEIEWSLRNDEFKKYVSTVGSLSPDECPSFYEQIDGVVFPSLLECFSATPLEAMVMEKPLFASDRGFVRDVCGSHAMYFNPLDANSVADHIANYFKSNLDRTAQLQQARNHALNFSSAKGRAEQYLEITQQHLES